MLNRANLPGPDRLPFTTWLAPGLPMALLEALSDHLETGLARNVSSNQAEKSTLDRARDLPSGQVSGLPDRTRAGSTG